MIINMFVSHYIAVSGGDLFPLVIIVVAILAQIIKATKGPKPTIAQPGQQDSGDYAAPEDELKKFLENLSGGGAEKPVVAPPPPEPLPVSKPQPRIIKPQQAARPVVVISQNKTIEESESPYDVAAQNTVDLSVAKPSFPERAKPPARNALQNIPAHIRKGKHHFRSMLMYQLLDRDSLRKAILLRELLGPCLALRQMGTGAPSL
jgi:hypothetical protein